MTTIDLVGALIEALRDPRVKAEVEAVVRKAVGEAHQASSSRGPRFEKIEDFAARHGICNRTTRNWIKRGLPHEKVGRVVRIVSEAADAWLGDNLREREIEQRAREDAAKSRRSRRAG